MICVRLSYNTDADIIKKLDEVDSKMGYIKELIRKDMQTEKKQSVFFKKTLYMYIRVCYTIYVLKVHRRKQEMTKQEMEKLKNFERNIKKMGNKEIVIIHSGLNRKSITNPTELNEAELKMVKKELLTRMK